LKTKLFTEKAPHPIGPYSQAIYCPEFKGLIFTSGQVALNAEGEFVGGDIKIQTRQVCENIKAILKAGKSSLKYVIKTTVFLKDMNDFPAMNEVYAEYFEHIKPARSTVEVSRLPKDALVEIDVIAHV